MTRTSRKWRMRYLGLWITLLASAVHDVSAQTEPATDAAAGTLAQAHFTNHDACVNCHFTQLGQGRIGEASPDFVQTTQSGIWNEQDKHRTAFSLLLEDSNRQLVEGMLGFDLRTVIRDGKLAADGLTDLQRTTVKQCLACHAARPFDDAAPSLPLTLGVSCQACHGPGHLWIQPHDDPEWRLVSAKEKSRLHLIDVRQPATRGRLCASCHVGDPEQHRVVTHEMYANGHPPLPSFELATFEEQMPRHWRTLAEKHDFRFWTPPPDGEAKEKHKAAIDAWYATNKTIFNPATQQLVTIHREEVKESYREANFPEHPAEQDPRQDLPRLRSALGGNLAVLRSYLQLLHGVTADRAEGRAGLPEFAVFDCIACHHELQAQPVAAAWSLRRSPPGRPPLPHWPLAVTRAALSASAEDGAADPPEKEFERRWQQLTAAVTRQPFGDPSRIAASVQELQTWLQEQENRLEREEFDAAAAQRALQTLTDPAVAEVADYHSARQIAWTIREILRDLPAAAPELDPQKRFDADAADPLALRLPSGQDKSVKDYLSRSLPVIANFDRRWFAAELESIRAQLPRNRGPNPASPSERGLPKK